MIRQAVPTDLGNLLDLLENQFNENQIPFEAESQIAALSYFLAHKELGLVLIALEEDQAVGFAVITLTWTLEHGGKSAWVDELFVLPEYRNEGLGSTLLEGVLEAARNLGCRAVDLEVVVDQSRAERLYQRYGFRKLERNRWVKSLE
jgi:ribosomal protein S18 acetylase RimI-like enzyme